MKNIPYVKVYSKDSITKENPKGLTNPIGPEGYLHQYPSARTVRKMMKPKSNNCRSDRNYLQVVSFYKDSEGKIVKKPTADMELIRVTRTIEHKKSYYRNISNSPKDYTVYEKSVIKPKEDGKSI